MSKRMLIDAAHPEEIRIAIEENGRLEDFDFETAAKKQIKGNIYLAKVTRVEPSLQAAFVEYGGNKQGFLPFSEIHFDYYQIPVADKEALIASMEQEAEEHNDEEGHEGGGRRRRRRRRGGDRNAAQAAAQSQGRVAREDEPAAEAEGNTEAGSEENSESQSKPEAANEAPADNEITVTQPEESSEAQQQVEPSAEQSAAPEENGTQAAAVEKEEGVETVGNETMEDMPVRRSSIYRRYKIQEVIKRNQILLVQVIKEERGNKGASLTTYISLAGRCCVFMPNTSRQGGVSRRIASSDDRKRLKGMIEDLEAEKGSSVIIRTAGLDRKKAEIKRDYDYLKGTWDEIRKLTVSSTAPALVYEEGDLIKRSLRDLYDAGIDEVLVEGEEAVKTAKKFMKVMMPSHVKRINDYTDSEPLFHRYQVEEQLAELYSNSANLPSGGSIVINPTEALVSIDVNSGRATRERNIEETALKTNLEAAKEIARQLRLRDLAGLIVIDFIDMMELRNRKKVEHALRDALASDRARIQVGRISTFGLLEMSRQRLRSSLVEANTVSCPRCSGVGYVRSSESTAVMLLRALESEATRTERDEICLLLSPDMAFYMLNYKRDDLRAIEEESEVKVIIRADHSIIGSDYRFDFNRQAQRQGDNRSSRRRQRRRGGRGRDRFRDRHEHSEHRETQNENSPAPSDTESGQEAQPSDESQNQEEGFREDRPHEGGHRDRGGRRHRGRRGGRGRDRDRGHYEPRGGHGEDRPSAAPAVAEAAEIQQENTPAKQRAANDAEMPSKGPGPDDGSNDASMLRGLWKKITQ